MEDKSHIRGRLMSKQFIVEIDAYETPNIDASDVMMALKSYKEKRIVVKTVSLWGVKR